jgi:hypothetical protein
MTIEYRYTVHPLSLAEALQKAWIINIFREMRRWVSRVEWKALI